MPMIWYLSVNVLLCLARVVLLRGEVCRGLGERPQLQQVEEVEVAQPVRAHSVGLLAVEPPGELVEVGPPRRRGRAEAGLLGVLGKTFGIDFGNERRL